MFDLIGMRLQVGGNEQLKIETGSYVGTGTTGPNGQNILTFGIKPRVVIISVDEGNAFISSQQGVVFTASGDGVFDLSLYGSGRLTVSGNTIKWYDQSSEPRYQFNISGQRYYYTVLGY